MPTTNNRRTDLLLEAERRGIITPDLQRELDTARQQGQVKGYKTPSVEQGRAASFYNRAMGANNDFLASGAAEKPRGLVREAVHEAFPNAENTFLNSPERQKADAAVRDFVAATLRFESGAAIPPQELETQRRIFFPMPGDTPETIAQKARARERAIEGLRIGSGNAADQVDALPRAGAQDGLQARVTLPDGREIVVPLPPEAAGDDEATKKAVRESLGGLGAGNPMKVLPDKEPPRGLGRRIDDFVRGVADTATFGLSDEIAAALGSATGIGGEQGDYEANLAAQRQRDTEGGAERVAGQFVGAVALPVGVAARTPAALAKVGAAEGAAYGFGSGTDDASRLGGAVKGGVAGGFGGYAFGKVAPAVASRLSRPPSAERVARNELGQAAGRLGIDLLPADVGGPGVRRMTAAAAQAPLSASPVIRAGQRALDQAHAARDRIAAGAGKALDADNAGDAAKAGAKAFIKNSGARASRLYDRAEQLAGNTPVRPTNALAALDKHIAELSEVPGGADGLEILTKLRDAMKDRTLTIAGVRGMRTALRDKFIKEGLRGSDVERRVREVIEAASEDVSQNLADAGLDNAADAYRAADRFYRERVATIDKVLTPIIGKDGGNSGEQVVRAIETAAKGNNARLAGFMKALPEDEAATVRASLIGRLGKASAGTQDASGEAFSLATFLTHWNQMTPSAKATLFAGSTRKALDDLAKVAEGAKAAAQYANRSNTAGAAVGNVSALFGAGVVVGPYNAALAALGQYAAGKLLASPRFARWLARAPGTANPKAREAFVKRLSEVATADPNVRNEVLALQQRLAEAMAQSPNRAAAEQEQN